MSPRWDPEQYSRFSSERDRAARDLLERLPAGLTPKEVWDLGCGEGRQAAWLKARWPEATVVGLDSSAEMLERARALDADVEWRLGGIAEWAPGEPADLVWANASLQWLPDHAALFPKLTGALAPGGVLAVQIPMAFETRHHTILREMAADGPWADALTGAARLEPLLTAEEYYDALAETCDRIEVWTTTYLHALEGEDAVLEWLKGTALRPMLTRLEDDPAMTAAFLEALSGRLRDAFPRRGDGRTLMPFPRLFLTARRRA